MPECQLKLLVGADDLDDRHIWRIAHELYKHERGTLMQQDFSHSICTLPSSLMQMHYEAILEVKQHISQQQMARSGW